MKTKAEIVEETIDMILEKGRALIPGSTNKCVYRMEEHDHPGCAVGRCIHPDKYEQAFENKGVSYIVNHVKDDIDSILIDDYKGHQVSFWVALQNLHDHDRYWVTNGKKAFPVSLSGFGINKLRELEDKYNFKVEKYNGRTKKVEA